MFVWKKEFELGIESIDNQHKKIIEIGNKISSLMKEHEEDIDSYDNIIAIVSELKDYTIYHFDYEEKLLLQNKYPDFENHKPEHEAFKEYILSIDFNEIDNNQHAFIKELTNKIITWLFKHILNIDFKYKDYLIEKGVK